MSGTEGDNTKAAGTATHEKEVERLFRWLLHEGTLFMSRQQYFAVVESILLAAYATTLDKAAVPAALGWAFPAVGLLVVLAWVYLNYYQSEKTILPIRKRLGELAPDYLGIEDGRKRWVRARTVTGLFIPALFAVLWICATLK